MNFLGKWSFEQNEQYITLDTISKKINFNATSVATEQKFNAYGTTDKFMLQASNGKYLVWSDGYYQASLARTDEVNYFALVVVGSDFRIVDLGIKGTGANQYYLDNISGALTRVTKSTTPASTTLFSQTIITVGLESILGEGFQSPEPDLSWVYLADQDLSTAMDFSLVNATNADFSRVNLSGVGMNSINFTNAKVVDAKMTGLGSDLSSAILKNADFTGTDFTEATLIQVDFTDATLKSVDMTQASLSQPNFKGANLTDLKMSNPPTGGSIDLMEMKFDTNTIFTGCQMRYTYLQNFDLSNMVFSHADLTGCKLDNAKLDRGEFSYVNLTGASLTGNISMNGTNFSNATLTEANMTGAQMGSIGLRFRVAEQADFDKFQMALTNNDTATVATIFSQNGYPLIGTVVITQSPNAPGRVWEVHAAKEEYTVRLEAVVSSNSLGVYQTVVAAILANAFMKGTTLTAANLFNVRAGGVQLYGGAKLDGGAILEGAQFDNANLGQINLKQAQLYGVNFNYTTLTGAQFQGAKMTVSSSGGAVSLIHCNLQGANFSDTTLDDAIFTDAAVSVNDENDTSLLNGVWLFDGAQTSSLSTELNNGKNSFSLATVLLPYLRQGVVSAHIIAGFKENGVTISDNAIVTVQDYGPYWQVTDGSESYVIFQSCDQSLYQPALGVADGTDDTQTPVFFMPLYLETQLKSGFLSVDVAKQFAENKITLSASATIEAKQQETDWLLTDPSTSYNLWRGLSKMSELTLTARPAIPGIMAMFASHSRALTTRAIITSAQTGRWAIDNDSNNPFNPVTNYIKFNVVSASENDSFNIFGNMMRVVQLSAKGELQYDNIRCDVTTLPVKALQGTTICPNSALFKLNEAAGTSYNEWMRAKELPQPPYCIPSADGTYYCPQKPPSSPYLTNNKSSTN